MKRVFYLLLAAFLFPQPALAWGSVGHAVVADIAEARLTPKAAAMVRELLASEGDKHLSDISSWADHIKPLKLTGAPAHSIRLPLDHSTQIIPDACPSHFCIVAGLNIYSKILADPTRTIPQREEALKFVVHLVGDIHQPLHTNAVTGKMMVVYEGRVYKLHKVWDTRIILDHGRDPNVIAQQLLATADQRGLDFGGDPVSWALEGRDIARDVIYTHVPQQSAQPLTLPANYGAQNWPIITARLTQAGIRLANILNHALG
jgi:nuclease S1